MFNLTLFELQKIWKKKTFFVVVVMLLFTNILMLWYTNQSHGINPELSSYREFQNDIIDMDELEKEKYIQTLYDDIHGIAIVNEILNCKKMPNEVGEQMAQQIMRDNEGIYEKYISVYKSGKYLNYTDSFEKEIAFIDEIYNESQKVFHYSSYKKEIEERTDMLNRVSIFSKEDDTFSSRNIIREAKDYANINPKFQEFYPSKGIMGIVKNNITDILIILIVILFASHLIFEEKEKNLFYVTKATKYGRIHYISAKIFALLIHCLIATLSFYFLNYIFYSFCSGVGNLFCSIQSFAPFVESTLPISTISFLIFSVLSKSMVMFVIGLMIVFVSIKSKYMYKPYLVVGIIMLLNMICYVVVPSQSIYNWLKYTNLFSFLNSHLLFGSYLNLNFMGYPISRLTVSMIILLLIIIGCILCSLYAFNNMKNFEISRMKKMQFFKWKPHSNLFYHELYKSFITNKVIIVLVFFIGLLGYNHFNQKYNLSPNEVYYQNMMMKLEGKLNKEKEELIQNEKERFDLAFHQIKRIEEMQSEGKLDEKTADSMKIPLYNETYFYSSFERILNQYENVRVNQGNFVYETGYALLSGIYENNKIIDYILITVCTIFMFNSIFAFEYQKKSWYLLSSTLKGKKAIVKNKLYIATLSVGIISIVSFVTKYYAIMKIFPMNAMFSSTINLSFFQGIGIMNVPIVLWIILMLFREFLVFLTIAIVVLIISDKLRQQLNTLFFSVLVLVIPLVLYLIGFKNFKWLSLFPFFNMTVDFTLTHSYIYGCLYIIALFIFVFMGIRYLLKERID